MLLDFPEINFPLGEWINIAFDWLTLNFASFFDVLTAIILRPMVWLEQLFLFIPWWVLLILCVALAWKLAGYKIAIFTFLGMIFIGIVGMWDLTITTLSITITAVVVSIFVGIITGILAAQNDRFEVLIRPVLDTLQTLPSFVYLIPAVFFFGLGKVPAVVATVFYAVPPCIRFTNLGIRQVATEAVEAGKAFGGTRKQLLFKIQLPQAKPTIMAGINQTVMMALAMVVVGSMVGASGVGLEVFRGLQRQDIGRGAIAGSVIVIIAIIIDRISQACIKTPGAEKQLKG